MAHLAIDTHFVPEKERATYLQDAMQVSPMPLINITESRFEDSGFRVRFAGKMLGDALMTQFDASSLHLKRTSKEISRQSSGILLLALLHRGSYDQTFEYHAPFLKTAPGDLLLADLDAPQSVTFTKSACTTCAYIPRDRFQPLIGSTSPLKPILLQPRDQLHGLLAACFMACASMRDPTPAAAAAALDTLTRLTLIAHGLHLSDHQALQPSLIEARRQQARQFIAARSDNPRLDPQMIADHLGLSLRSLNLAFEPTGQGVAALIQATRLARAKDMLLRLPDRSTLDIALACGFNTLATFYRRFVQEYGVAPGEFRRTRARSTDDRRIDPADSRKTSGT